MKRRHFIATSSLAAGSVLGCNSMQNNNIGEAQTNDLEKLPKVKNAMLAFQRYSWEQGVASMVMIDLCEEHTSICMAIGAAKRQQKDGRLGWISGTSVTDPMSCGEAVLYAAIKTGDGFLKEAHAKMLDYAMNIAPRSKNGTLYHFDNRPVIWVDSIFMAPPFLSVSGEYKEAYKQIKGMREVVVG